MTKSDHKIREETGQGVKKIRKNLDSRPQARHLGIQFIGLTI